MKKYKGPKDLKDTTNEKAGPLAIFLTLALFAMAFILLFYKLGLAPLGKAEGRIAEVVREMLIKKDYLHPTCLWIPYVTKPFIPYWLVIGITGVRGGLDELTLRLPSAIGAFSALLATYFLGCKIFSRPAALLGAGVLATCLGLIQWGRCAAPDMLNLAAIIVAVAWYWHWKEEPRPWAVFVFGCLVALAGHMKGMAGIVITLMVVAIDIVLWRRLKGLLEPVIFLSFVTGLCLYLVPFLISAPTTGSLDYNWLSTAFHETVTRAIKPFDHKGSPFMYLEFVPIWMLPWAPLFLAMLYVLFRQFRLLALETKWLLLAFCAIFAMFTLAGSRRSYYILPVLPFCALITGAALEKGLPREAHEKWAFSLQACFFLLLACLVILFSGWGLLVGGIPFPEKFLLIVMVHGVIILALAALCLFWLRRGKSNPHSQALVLMFTAFITMAGISCIEKPFLDKDAPEKTFVKQIGQILTRDQDITPAYFRLGTRARTRVSFYLGQKGAVKNFIDTRHLQAAISSHGSWLFILSRQDKSALMDFFTIYPKFKVKEILAEGLLPWEGWPGRQKKERQDKLLCLQVTMTGKDRQRHDPNQHPLLNSSSETANLPSWRQGCIESNSTGLILHDMPRAS